MVRRLPRPRPGRLALALSLLALLSAAACVTAPIQGTPRAEAENPAGLRLVGVVTVEGDTVRFDRPRADDPTGRDVRPPRVEGDAVVGTSFGRPTTVPLDDVAVFLHREEEEASRGALYAAGAAGIVVVAGTLAWLLAGGL